MLAIHCYLGVVLIVKEKEGGQKSKWDTMLSFVVGSKLLEVPGPSRKFAMRLVFPTPGSPCWLITGISTHT
jgi:hypothetical protein